VGREIGIGLVGVGWMGQLHTVSYRRVADHYPELGATPRFVIAADEVAARGELAHDRLGYEQVTTDWRDVLAHPEVEAVSITAPNFMHREVGVAAAEAGKHFWGEKPLGRSPEETAEIAAAVDSAGVRTIVGLNYRHPPAVQYAKRLIDTGRLGEITRYRGRFLADYAHDPRGALSWRFMRDLAGLGVLGDLMSHTADLAQFLLGPIARVTAATETQITERPKLPMGSGTHFTVVEGGELAGVENEDGVLSLVEFAGGVRGSLEATRVLVGPHVEISFEVHGTEGMLRWDFQRMNELEVFLPLATGDQGFATVFMSPDHPEYAHFQPGPAIPMSYDDLKVIEAHLFLESVLDGQQREPGVREMLEAAKVIDAMARSAESGRWEDVRDLSP
jgi:predicted dehydrogenase